MSNEAITQLVAALAALVASGAFVALVVVPVLSAYQRAWERVVAGLLSLWVLAAFVGVGIGVGAAVVYYWPRVF
jgi:hypothetical protein